MTAFKPVFLVSDLLLFVLLAALAAYLFSLLRDAPARMAWRVVFRSRIGAVSGLLLGLYVTVGLLDSIHYQVRLSDSPGQAAPRYDPEVLSLLDGLLADIRLAREKTYSAPLAAALYAKESQILPDGRAVRVAPPLQHRHWLGTDKVGQDVLYLALKGIRTGLLIGTLTTLITLPFALGLGVAAGYFGGRIDDAIQYLYTTLNSIPGVLLIAATVLVVDVQIERHAEQIASAAARADLRLVALCAILGMTQWTGLARLLRAETLKLRELDYIQAARAFQVSPLRILRRHVLPNVGHLILITVVLDFSGLVLAEAVLSYIGAGVDPATVSWGNMINGARLELAREPVVWWQLAAAFIFMFGLVLAANLFADRVREAFDPRGQA